MANDPFKHWYAIVDGNFLYIGISPFLNDRKGKEVICE